jgi:hypothetical protein
MKFPRRLSCAKPCLFLFFLGSVVSTWNVRQACAQESTAPQKTAPALGTIQTITEKSLTLKTDAGAQLTVQIPAEVKVLRVEPGSKTLKDAVKIQLSDLAVGDRILVRGDTSGQPNVMVASTIVAMKKEDIAKKQARERDEWQRHGIGGLVKSVDPSTEAVVVSTLSGSGTKDIVIHAPVGTILRRYAPGSISFDEAKIAPITDIRAGDQLRARGSRSADGSEFTADEIVSGSFQNISGTIASIDAAKSSLTILDLATKKNVEVSVTSQSQLRKLPAEMAQRIAARLKGVSPQGNGDRGPSTGAAAPAGNAGQSATPSGGQGGAGGTNGAAGPGGGQRGSGDLQQVLSRLPVSPLTDFQKGDAVMIVAASSSGGTTTAITLLGGVEPILQSSPQGQASSILTPWSLSSGGGDAGTQ